MVAGEAAVGDVAECGDRRSAIGSGCGSDSQRSGSINVSGDDMRKATAERLATRKRCWRRRSPTIIKFSVAVHTATTCDLCVGSLGDDDRCKDRRCRHGDCGTREYRQCWRK